MAAIGSVTAGDFPRRLAPEPSTSAFAPSLAALAFALALALFLATRP
ncbi:hypothetical protein [uncultured Pseudomonas sp.]|uniref:Uncharacterized protein n=1 Tax=Ectopseudomonas oleovorans TaxID=301 RepID=A0A3D9EF33_ECTOL|nr:hypothetical protein [uncultured Pseudomonas sp.]RED01814.1 hypothetical protein DFO60_3436 [Pseudomonas oleovorans]